MAVGESPLASPPPVGRVPPPPQEKLRTNYAYVFPAKGARYQYVCEVRSCHELKMRSTSTLYMSTTKPPGGGLPDIVVSLPFLEIPLPLPVLFKVLGAQTRDEAIGYIQCSGEPEVEAIVRSIFDSDVHATATPDEMFEGIGREATRETTRERRHKYTGGAAPLGACHARARAPAPEAPDVPVPPSPRSVAVPSQNTSSRMSCSRTRA